MELENSSSLLYIFSLSEDTTFKVFREKNIGGVLDLVPERESSLVIDNQQFTSIVIVKTSCQDE